MKRLLFIPLSLALFAAIQCQHAFAEQFTVSDIRLEGLQRVSAGTVFRAFPINLGDTVNESTLVEATRSLFKTGNFNDIQISRDGNVLVLSVEERPFINLIQIDGNKAIGAEELLEGLSRSGLEEGEIFKRATLEGMRVALIREYISQGQYGVEIETEVESHSRNRVAIYITITEGKASSVKQINIVGNTVFNDEELIDLFELKTTNWLTFYRGDDKYSKQKLSGDLERLKTEYLDNGYINFNIESTQVSVTPDKSNIYVTINVVEGDKFTIGEIDFAGDLVLEEEELRKFLAVKSGDVFSNKRLTTTTEWLTKRLGNEGYTFANVNAIPQPNEDTGLVDIKLFIDPGKRAYVRRVNFKGNTSTIDEVLRREMRQMESGWASSYQIEQSKQRLERLGFFKEVNVETPQVPGTTDQIDVNYTVEEQPSGSISASIGFAQEDGLIFGAGISQNNFLGSGNRVSINLNRSAYQTSYNFSFMDPYYTTNGVTAGFDLFFREVDYDDYNISSYATDSFGGGLTFGYPISESQSISLKLGFESTSITEGLWPAIEILEFLDREGNDHNVFLMTFGWREYRLNRGVFATRGSSQSLSLEVAAPGSDLTYYRLNYNGQVYFPLSRTFTLRLRTNLAYGDAYGDTYALPFYKHYFAGGLSSVRGFERAELGPRSTPHPDDIDQSPDPLGGNMLVTAGADIIFPFPFLKDTRSVQSSLFVDVGNVFNSECASYSFGCQDFDLGELRYSAGIGATWLSGFGPLTFSIAQTFNEGPQDDTEFFQFQIGKTF